MDHEGARKLMAEAMGGQLSTDDERDLALHLVGCPECKTIYEGLQKAHPALESIELGHPSKDALEHAVHRAQVVLRGEADPGPMGLTEEPPRLPDVPDATTIRIDTSVPAEEQLVPAGPLIATGPMPTHESPPAGVLPIEVPETHVRAIEAEPVAAEQPVVEEDALDIPVLAPEVPEVETAVEPGAVEVQPVATGDVAPVEPPSEIERLLEEDRTRYDQLPLEEAEEGERMGPGPWLVAIAVTVALAVLAGILIFRGQGLFGTGGNLPSAETVQSRIRRAFADMKSLKASFEIQKLNLYRVGRDGGSLTYRFANGTYTGSIDYDRAEGYKQDIALQVGDEELERAEIVQTSDETRSLVGSADDQELLVEQNPPLGPPDGNFRPTFAVLEESLGAAARILIEADDLSVAGITEREGRELYEVRAGVEADELTRADRIEAALDANTFLPVIVKRSISRDNARVLAPESALDDDALDTAFAENGRLTTELVELAGVSYDEIVLPGDLTLDVPDGANEEPRDSRYERLTRAELGSKLDFEPLLPRTLPDGYEEQLLAVYNGEQRGWGPGNAYPEPASVFHSSYFDGKTTIVVTQRRMADRFELRGSPLTRTGLPITVEAIDRGDNQLFYGHSPEVPPHVYGFIGNVFVLVSGYAPQSELRELTSALTETPVDVPELDVSPSPGVSPGGSPAASPVASPAGTPAATASPAP